MSILSPKPQKRHALLDPIVVLLLSALVLLMFFALFTGNIEHIASNLLGSYDSAPAALSASSQPSFAADQQYWNSNCSHGWNSDSGCDAIVTRTQSCSISVNSAYCSEYESYMQQYISK